MRAFWREFFSGNNAVVHSPTVIMAFIGLVLATPIVLFSLQAAYFHIFTLRKGLDGPSVNLLLGLLGAATGGLGAASYYSKTITSQVSGFGGLGEAPYVPPGAPPARAKPAP